MGNDDIIRLAMSDTHSANPSTISRQIALQGAAIIAVLSLAWPYFGWRGEALPWPETSFVIGFVALTFATISRQPWPWRLLHALFMPLIWATLPLHG